MTTRKADDDKDKKDASDKTKPAPPAPPAAAAAHERDQARYDKAVDDLPETTKPDSMMDDRPVATASTTRHDQSQPLPTGERPDDGPVSDKIATGFGTPLPPARLSDDYKENEDAKDSMTAAPAPPAVTAQHQDRTEVLSGKRPQTEAPKD
jgi:hypothetical protein